MLFCNLLTYLCACYWLWGVCCQIVNIQAWVTPIKPCASTAKSSRAISSSTTSSSTKPNYRSPVLYSGASSKDKPIQEGEDDHPPQTTSSSSTGASRNWLEAWAMEGAEKIAHLDIQERTQRTLLAEMAEDKIYELNVALEDLVDEDTGEIADLEQAKDIAMQTKSLQEQYRALVTGEPSTMLQAMASLKEISPRKDKSDEYE